MAYKFNPFTGMLDYYKDVINYGTAHPATAKNGTLFYDTDDAILYIYISGWIAIGSGTPPSTVGQPIGLLLGLTRAT